MHRGGHATLRACGPSAVNGGVQATCKSQKYLQAAGMRSSVMTRCIIPAVREAWSAVLLGAAPRLHGPAF